MNGSDHPWGDRLWSSHEVPVRTSSLLNISQYTYIYIERERDRLVSFLKDLRSNPSHSNSTLRHSNTRSTPLKLIYNISSIYKPRIKCFEYFLPIHQGMNEVDPLKFNPPPVPSNHLQNCEPFWYLLVTNLRKQPKRLYSWTQLHEKAWVSLLVFS